MHGVLAQQVLLHHSPHDQQKQLAQSYSRYETSELLHARSHSIVCENRSSAVKTSHGSPLGPSIWASMHGSHCVHENVAEGDHKWGTLAGTLC